MKCLNSMTVSAKSLIARRITVSSEPEIPLIRPTASCSSKQTSLLFGPIVSNVVKFQGSRLRESTLDASQLPIAIMCKDFKPYLLPSLPNIVMVKFTIQSLPLHSSFVIAHLTQTHSMFRKTFKPILSYFKRNAAILTNICHNNLNSTIGTYKDYGRVK